MGARGPRRRRRLQPLRGRLQAVRRPVREPRLRRAQSRGQGGVSRQRPRRCARPVGERRGARGARRVGVDRQPARRLGTGRGAARRPDARPGRSPAAGGGDPRTRPRAWHPGVARGAGRRPRRRTILLMNDLSHVDESGAVRMVDVGGKELSRRRAGARAEVRMAPETARILRELPKGDALATAQLAGIMAAKRTSELIPLCHPLPLTHVEVTLDVGEDSVEILASAETTAQTGVEMEALTAASVAALTVYDMAKAVDKQMRIAQIALVEKTKEHVS